MSHTLPNDPTQVAKIMLSWHDLELISCTTIQTLWAGYGQICAITARANTPESSNHLSKLCGVEPRAAGFTYNLILKLISPPRASADEGHLRKMLSYEVEQRFYSDVVPLLDEEVHVAKCLASTRDLVSGSRDEEQLAGIMATIMIDLRDAFPVMGGKRSALSSVQVHGALDWLAAFHRCSWALLPDSMDGYVLPPLQEHRRRESGDGVGDGLWLNGGYTYLATRMKEYTALSEDDDSEWSECMCTEGENGLSLAETVAVFLSPRGRAIESYIHGDVKSENLFTSKKGDEVAFFDFQYVGLGLGVCDLAKLFTCSVPLEMLVDEDVVDNFPERLEMCDGESELLKRYHEKLVRDKKSDFYEWGTFLRHWETALVDWCRFQASWGFWGNTEWLEARVRAIIHDKAWTGWLYENVDGRGFVRDFSRKHDRS
ncbi:hypothetical protein N7456_001112 [Penicillium angulare]|uniref:Aminoglycoside phosphotransferase domain-containing protein n=1 Tax=Penicillium angulare TaxID=116970 RepID=A0A9W9KSW3_9EURO|nr:hypothetical protein N7456_001112 [Penicillium angulare]